MEGGENIAIDERYGAEGRTEHVINSEHVGMVRLYCALFFFYTCNIGTIFLHVVVE